MWHVSLVMAMSENAPTKYDAWAYLIIGLMAIPVVALGIGALVLPPGISISLVRRGLEEGRTSWVLLGILAGGIWLLLLVFFGRKLLRGTPVADKETAKP